MPAGLVPVSDFETLFQASHLYLLGIAGDLWCSVAPAASPDLCFMFSAVLTLYVSVNFSFYKDILD